MRAAISFAFIVIALTGCAPIRSVTESCEASTKTFVAMVNCVDHELATLRSSPRHQHFKKRYMEIAKNLKKQVVAKVISETVARRKLWSAYKEIDSLYRSGSAVPTHQVAAFDPATAPESTISAAELQKHAETVRRYKPKDQFDLGPDLSSLIGETFVVEMAPRPAGPENEICPGTPIWSYWPDKSELVFRHGGGLNLGEYRNNNKVLLTWSNQIMPWVLLFGVNCTVAWGQPYTGSNAFGVSTTVHVRNETFISLGFRSRLRLRDSWRAQVSPNQARTLTNNVRMRVYGQVGEWTSGRPILCGVKTDAPELRAAIEKNYRGCFINSVIHRVEIVDTATGTVLKHWTPKRTE